MKLKIRKEKQWNEDDGTKWTSEDVNKKGTEGEKKLDCLCVLKLELINQVLIIELVKLFVLI